jgi:hypothetical protein
MVGGIKESLDFIKKVKKESLEKWGGQGQGGTAFVWIIYNHISD